MDINEYIDSRIREIVREEIASMNGSVKRFTCDQLAERWHTNADSISRLARSGQLRGIRLSERKIVFSVEEVLRFEQAGGIDQLQVAA